MTELLIAEGLFTYRLAKRKMFALRAAGAIVLCYIIAWFYPVIEGVSYNGWYASLMFLALFLVTFGAVMFVYRISVKNALFVSITAYTAQHLAYELFKLAGMPFDFINANSMYNNALIDFSALDSFTLVYVFVYFDIYLAVYAVVYFLLGRKMNRNEDFRLKNASIMLFAAIILLVDIILNAIVIYIDKDYNKTYDVIVAVYNNLCCLLVFYLQHSVLDIKDMRRELETVSHLLLQSQQQYELKKEEINLINIKCHDLKHMLANYAVRGSLDEDSVAEMTEMISIYDTTVKTGNEVIDVILTEKSLLCRSKGINFTCMADCSELDFIKEGDLYAMFGNILDNAVEAASQVTEEEKKCISLNVRTVSGCVSVLTQNYYEGEITFEDGYPVTTKTDKKSHGYGIRSIRAIAEKYGGLINIKTEDGIFIVSLLIPVGGKK